MWQIYMPGDLLLTFFEGHRTIEGRAMDFFEPNKDYRQMRRGHMAMLFDDDSECYLWIKDVRYYADAKSMLETEGLEALVPGIEPFTVAAGIKHYHSFRGYRQRIEDCP